MIARAARPARSGITLTEVLISILIMGVGLISLATLFPLGLLRMREATRYNRTGLLFESAADDMDARALLFKSSFLQTWYGPRDPFLQDVLPDGTYLDGSTPPNVTALNSRNAGLSVGLPFVYDPLWRDVTGILPATSLVDKSLNNGATYAAANVAQARFGAAVIGTTSTAFNIDDDPDGNLASAHGLQRLTNFIPYPAKTATFTSLYNFTHNNPSITTQPADVAADVFTSVDDILFHSGEFVTDPVTKKRYAPSPLLPDLTSGSMVADYKYSWFFTGRQVDITNSSQLVGDIVICDSRPFAFDSVPNLNGGAVTVPAGETTVEAIFGFGRNIPEAIPGLKMGYAAGGDRSVLLRWKVGMPDPSVRVGGWIADVTYERDPARYASRAVHGTAPNLVVTPFARCHWYQVIKKTEAETETANSAGPNNPGTYRRMVLTINSNVRTKTLLSTADAKPVNSNFALVMPSVINVFPRAFEVH